ncbi:MAG: hypothetical protein ACK5Z5_06740 [Neisseriaceae bacterium]
MIKNKLFNENDSLNSYLYNFNLTLNKENLDKFANIKYVLMQGSQFRAELLAQKLAYKLLGVDPIFFKPINLINSSKFVIYRIKNVLSVSHGMGNTSLLTLLHNLSKVLYLAGNRDLEYIRIGTSGGIGIKPGSVVLTKEAYMPTLIPGYKISALGKDIIYPTIMNTQLNLRIIAAQPENATYNILIGNSIAADDFYLSQVRFDGAIKPNYTHDDKQKYFDKLKTMDILNIEMESTGLAAFCNRANIPVAMVAAVLVNRMKSDQITATTDELVRYAEHAQEVVLNYITSKDSGQSIASNIPR